MCGGPCLVFSFYIKMWCGCPFERGYGCFEPLGGWGGFFGFCCLKRGFLFLFCLLFFLVWLFMVHMVCGDLSVNYLVWLVGGVKGVGVWLGEFILWGVACGRVASIDFFWVVFWFLIFVVCVFQKGGLGC